MCTQLYFTDVLAKVTLSDAGAPSDWRCRFEVSTAEGESLDVVIELAGSYPFSSCCFATPAHAGCKATLRDFVTYSWAVSVNGVALGTDIVQLPGSWDAGVAPVDVAEL